MFEFSEDEDKFLTCALYKFGYGAWELIRNGIRNSNLFRFNWIAKSRTAIEIGKRCEFLVTKFKREVAYEKDQQRVKTEELLALSNIKVVVANIKR